MPRTDELTKLILEHDRQVDYINQSISQLNNQLYTLGVTLNAIITNPDYEASTTSDEKATVLNNLVDITPISVVFEKII